MRITLAGCGVVAALAVVLGWMQNPNHITASEAVSAAEAAFAASGITGAEVEPKPEAGVYEGKADGPVRVWKTIATIEGGTIQLWLARSDGKSMFLDDRTQDGAYQLLTDEQFNRLAGYYENPAEPRQLRRNVALTLAALLVIGFAGLHHLRPELLATARERPADPAPSDPPPPPRRTEPLRALET